MQRLRLSPHTTEFRKPSYRMPLLDLLGYQSINQSINYRANINGPGPYTTLYIVV